MPESSEIKSVVVIVANPIRKGDLGEVAEGHYLVENGIITMTNADGIPLRDDNTGRRITHTLERGEDAKGVAKRLVLRQYRTQHRDEMSGFHRRIDYGPSSVA
jgi:hypothetical protein